jgi:hypothetical protein
VSFLAEPRIGEGIRPGQVTLKWVEVMLLARLGGWTEQKDSLPGKVVLTRALRRLADMLYTQAFLDRYRRTWSFASSHCSVGGRATTPGPMAKCQPGLACSIRWTMVLLWC